LSYRRIQVTYDLFYGTLLFMGDAAQGPMVSGLGRKADGMVQEVRRNMMRVGDERNTHPLANGFIFPANESRVTAGAVAKDKRQRDGEDQS
jgi:hypothetical protein